MYRQMRPRLGVSLVTHWSTGFLTLVALTNRATADQGPDVKGLEPRPPKCRLRSPSHLELRGPMDQSMDACVEARMTETVRKVTVSSPGGDTKIARRIARRMSKSPRQLVIDGMCFSSCANYLVPVASEVVVTADGLIGLHGTPDPFTLGKQVKATKSVIQKKQEAGDLSKARARQLLQELSEELKRELDDEAQFAADFSVSKGWRLYRDAHASEHGFLKYFQGTPRRPLKHGWTFLIVESAMLRSCLPRVKAPGFQGHMENKIMARQAEIQRLEDMGFVLSGTLSCAPQ